MKNRFVALGGALRRFISGTMVVFLLVVIGAASDAGAVATTYYVDAAAGSDVNAGTSEAGAWATIGRVNAVDFEPGDRVLFKGGQTFGGNLRLGAEDVGTAGSPVSVGSYGTGRATLSAGTGTGIDVYNVGGVEVTDLIISGAGRTGGNTGSGVQFYTDLGGATKLDYVRVENVEAKGFGHSGVSVGAYPADGTKSGFRDVRITNVSAHDNADAGIQFYGYFSNSASGWSHANVYVGHCSVYNNTGIPNKGSNSGSGIVLGDVNGATIERCESYNNGALNNYPSGGPAGIWTWDSNAVTIQYNESHHNKTGTKDGGGFDLDGGVTNSIMQYNYSHDNAGSGYWLYQFAGARPSYKNVLRYNVSENDGRAAPQSLLAGGAKESEIYNNTVFVKPRADGGPISAVKTVKTVNVHFRNNIFVTTGNASMLLNAAGQKGLLFQGNDYWSSGSRFLIKHGTSSYNSLNAWRSATGQERIGSTNTGLSVDPQLTNPGNGGTIGDADQLSSLGAYKLRAGSPMTDAALNLQGHFGVNPGPKDFYGTTLFQGSGYDIGAHEITLR